MIYQEPPDKSQRTDTWKLEEKQTDVNIALDLYRDASQGLCEQIVLCTNDTDIAPALQYVRKDFPNIRVGVVIPIRTGSSRSPAKSLIDNAHWVRRLIHDQELSGSQFPDRVPTNKKPVDKPDYW